MAVARKASPSALQLAGRSLHPGVCNGPALVCDGASRPRVAPGYVLVARQLTPALIPLLAEATGIVVERGHLLHAAATVARELGLPIVVVPSITRFAATGDLLFVDALDGTVELTGQPI